MFVLKSDYGTSGDQEQAIQELIRENNQLKTQLSSLEARIAALENP